MKPPKADSVMGRVMRRTVRSAVRMPDAVAHRLFGAPPRNDRGAPLDMQMHILLNLMEVAQSPEIHELGQTEAREVYRRANQTFDLAPRPMSAIKNIEIPGPAGDLPARVYRPRSGTLPACIFYHGGGFVIGSRDGYEGFCTAIAERADCVVISVDYRLAPECPFPAAVEDTVAAFQWIYQNADEFGIHASKIAVGGDSAGGNLATVVCQELIGLDEPLPVHQLLVYPKTHYKKDYPSRELFAEGFLLSNALVEWFSDCYLCGADTDDPRVSPLLFDDLDKMPPATVITAGFDPIRDEGEAYAKRLKDAGVPVIRRCCDTMVHGFITMGGVVDTAACAIADIAEEFGEALR